MGKYSKIVNSKNQPENQKAVNAENYQAGNLENIKDRKPENQKEELVNLSIKVPRRLRQKWVAESRLRGTTLTAIITDYLKKELGD